MKISNRLAVAIVMALITAVAGMTISQLIHRQLGQENLRHAIQQIKTEMNFHRIALMRYMEEIDQDLALISSGIIAPRIVTEMEKTFRELGQDATGYLQNRYIDSNPYKSGRRQQLVDARDGSAYSRLHAEIHPTMRAVAESRGYYDIFLISPTGDVVYTVYKETDYATNLDFGKFGATELAGLFRDIRDDKEPGILRFVDFVHYKPSNNRPAAFIGTQIRQDDRVVGVLIFQLKTDSFRRLTGVSKMLGDHGEILVIGQDHLARTNSRQGGNESALELESRSDAVTRALAGGTGVLQTMDYRNREVLAGFAPIQWHDVSWALIVNKPISAIDDNIRWIIEIQFIFIPVIMLIAFLVGFLLAASEPEGEES